MVAQATKATPDADMVAPSVAEARSLERALNGLLDEFARTVEGLTANEGDTLTSEMKLMVHAAGVKKLDVALRKLVSESSLQSQPILAEAGRAKLALINARTTAAELQAELQKYSSTVSTVQLDKLKASVGLPDVDNHDDKMVDALECELDKRKKLGTKLAGLSKTKHERNSKLTKNKAKLSMLPRSITTVGKALKQLAQFEEEEEPPVEEKGKSGADK